MDSLVICLIKRHGSVPAIITGLPVEAVLRVVGIFICAKLAKCLAVERVREETGTRLY
jgi:hypothetical protein